jgi:hypothetical protein
VNVPVADKEPTRLVVAWKRTQDNPVVSSFGDIAVASSGKR